MPWSDLLNRILAAATSGQGPDVLNIGNTWSSSLQATGPLLPWGQRPVVAGFLLLQRHLVAGLTAGSVK